MGKVHDLNNFDCGMIVGARLGGSSISESAALIENVYALQWQTILIQCAAVLWLKMGEVIGE